MPTHNWSDDVDDNGVKTVTEIKTNENGEKVKVTKKIQLKTQVTQKKWKKFGACKGFQPGPDSESTTIGERVMLKLALNSKDLDEPEEDQAKKSSSNTKIVCRICKGDHWTTKCPFKDTYQPLNEIASKADTKESNFNLTVAKGGNKYVPPSKRGGAAGDKPAGRERDDTNAIRISNLSEETTDGDVRELLRNCGPTQRVFVAKDHATGLCKGYAFITFYNQEGAEHAIKTLNGHGFDNLILKVDWAQRDRN
ncbi:translation initiation factor eIF3 subunit g [Terramyces sp. JEL0728]|nr:translation initiation factor eIF3 subunit g [Terramyces sp. JEL0728]